jgi:hypothetical protein
MRRKAQAAMEYLMTYGWAILVVIIVLAALWSMGIFAPRIPKTACMNDVYFEAVDWDYKSDGTFRVSIGNKVGRSINLTTINVTVGDTYSTLALALVVPPGEKSGIVTVTGLPTGKAGDKVEPTVKISYDIVEGMPNLATTCKITGTMS